jgi:hypothetical protein
MANGNMRDLVIGFDFGTAATKVIVRDVPLRQAHAINFLGHAHTKSPYFLPSVLGLTNKGQFTLAKAQTIFPFKHIKIRLIDNIPQAIKVNGERLIINPISLAAIYIGLALRTVKATFLEENNAVYRHVAPIWQLNIGMPTKNYDSPEIEKNFRNAAKLGWWLSEGGQIIDLTLLPELERIQQDARFDFGIHVDYVNVVPEIAAQVAGYAKSRLRQEGLHVLVDIGATTLDIASFVLSAKEGEDRYAFMDASVSRYGCNELHAWRIAKVSEHIPKWLSQMECSCDLIEEVPDKIDPYCPKPSDLPNADREFLENATSGLAGVIRETKQNKYPGATEWDDGVPLFLCGGGSGMRLYKESLISNAKSRLSVLTWKGFKRVSLPKPDGLSAHSLREGEYHRLSVAYGLSYPIDDIGKIIPPRDVSNIKIERSGKFYEFISKDMV